MINLEEEFSPRVNPADANYPFGSIKGNSSPGANDGTPLAAVWGNDFEGFRQAAMTEAGITPSGLPDTAQDSQLMDALDKRYLEIDYQAWTFATGGTLTDCSQAVRHTDGNYYSWTGAYPKVVAPGTDPTVVAGYVPRSGVYGKTDDWTPSIVGALNTGTYQLATAIGKISRSGNIVTLTGHIVLAGTVTGGGAGAIFILGIPIPKPNNGVRPVGSVLISGIPFTGDPVLLFVSSGASSELMIALNKTNAAPEAMQITDVGPGDYFNFSITYTV